MKKRTYLKKLARALKGVPAREQEDLVAYYDELIEDRLEQGKSPRQVFAELEPPEKVAETYLRDVASEKSSDDKRGYRVRKEPLTVARFAGGLLAAVASIVLAALIFSFAVAGVALAIAGVYALAISFGLLFAGHAALFFAQWGMASVMFALAMLSEILTVVLAKGLAGMWRLVVARPTQKNPMQKRMRRALIAGCAMLLGGQLMFVAAFGALGFRYQNLAVTDGLVTHEEQLTVSDEMVLEVDNSAVTVKRSEDETCKLVYRDFPEVPRRFAFGDGKAVLGGGSEGFSVMGASLSLQWHRGLLVGAVTEDLQSAELYLPASFAGALSVEVKNGEVSIADMVCSDLVITVINGAISLSDVAADTVKATTVNGAVKLQNITAGSVWVETTNGVIKFDNVRAETVKAEIKTGAIVLKDVACARVHAATSTGEISLEDLRADFITLHTSTGAVSGTVAGKEEDYAITASCSTGSCNLHDRQGGSKQLDVRVSTGAVNITFAP